MAQNGSDDAAVEPVARRVIGTGLDGLSVEPAQDFIQRRFEQVSDRRECQAGRHIPRSINGDAVPSRIAGFQFLPAQPAHIVFDELSKVARRNQLVVEEAAEHGGRA